MQEARGKQGKRGAVPEKQEGVGAVNSRGEVGGDEAQRKMKTVREITGKPGRMCNESGEQGTERGGREEEVMGKRSSAVCF